MAFKRPDGWDWIMVGLAVTVLLLALLGTKNSFGQEAPVKINLADDAQLRKIAAEFQSFRLDASANSSGALKNYCKTLDERTDGLSSHPLGISEDGRIICVNDIKDIDFATFICASMQKIVHEFDVQKQTVICTAAPMKPNA